MSEAKTEDTKRPAANVKKAEAKTDHLVEMVKGGETLSVHPSCVAAHQRAGWVEA